MTETQRDTLAAPLWGLRPASDSQLVELYKRYTDKVVAEACRKRPALARLKEDCLGNAYLALIKCVRDFEPEQGVKFITYLHTRVWGACHDTARKDDWVPHTARSIDSRRRQAEADYIHIPDMMPLGEQQIRIESTEAEENAMLNEWLDTIKVRRHRRIVELVLEHGIEKAAKLDGSSEAACEMVVEHYSGCETTSH